MSNVRAVLVRRVAVGLLALGAAACASTAVRPQQLSDSATVLPTPLVEQGDLNECGLAALSSLCDYYRVEIPEAERQELARLADEEQGLSGAELRTALQGLGFDVFVFEGTFDQSPTGVLNHIARGRPLLVMMAHDGANHYSLLIGHDPERRNVVLLDPNRGRVLLPDETFQSLWGAVRHFTLLAVPAAPVPAGVASTQSRSEPDS